MVTILLAPFFTAQSEMVALNDGMIRSAVHIEDQSPGAFEDRFVGRPSAADDLGLDIFVKPETPIEDGDSGVVFMLPGRVAGFSGDENDFDRVRGKK